MNSRKHFALLAVAFVALLAYAQASRGRDLRLVSFALYGGLHALCVVFARAVRVDAGRIALVVVLAAASDVLMLYLGFSVLGLLAGLSSSVALYGALGVAAFFGALLYGSLLRGLLFPMLRPRRIVQIALLCLVASLTVASIGLLRASTDLIWLVGAWWLAFSSGLMLAQRRFDAFRSQAQP